MNTQHEHACTYIDEVIVCPLQDGLQALVADLDHPAIRRNKNVEQYLTKCKLNFSCDLF